MKPSGKISDDKLEENIWVSRVKVGKENEHPLRAGAHP